MDEKRRTEVLAQLHHKLLREPHEQPSAAEVEEVAWWEACELDRTTAAREHLRAEVRRLRSALVTIRDIERYVGGRPCSCSGVGCVECIARTALDGGELHS